MSKKKNYYYKRNCNENPKCQALALGVGGSSFWFDWEVGSSLALGSASLVLASTSFTFAVASLSLAAFLAFEEDFFSCPYSCLCSPQPSSLDH